MKKRMKPTVEIGPGYACIGVEYGISGSANALFLDPAACGSEDINSFPMEVDAVSTPQTSA